MEVRNELFELRETHGNQLFLFKAIYRHRENLRWATFTNLTVNVNGTDIKIKGKHINLPRIKVAKRYQLEKKDNNKQFQFSGKIGSYNQNGTSRANIMLHMDKNFKRIA